MSTAVVRAGVDRLTLTGPQRAALMVMVLDRPVAREVLRHLSDGEVEEIGRAMAEVSQVDAALLEQTVQSFVRDLHEACLVPRTGPEFAVDVLPQLVDEPRRPRLVTALRRRLSSRLADAVVRHPARTVATILLEEHPQTCAVALLLMGEENAANVLARFPDAVRAEVATRMAKMERIPASLADEVEDSLLLALSDAGSGGLDIEGVGRTAKILGRLISAQQQQVLDGISATQPDLSDILRKRMIVFDDLERLDDRGIQTLLKSVERERLVLALRGARAEILDLVLRNMSARTAQDLRDEIDMLGPRPKSTIEAAREEIVQIVLHLREEGTVTLSSGDSELV